MSIDPYAPASKVAQAPNADLRTAAAVDQARKQMLAALWQVALGETGEKNGDGALPPPGFASPSGSLSLESLLAAQEQGQNALAGAMTAPQGSFSKSATSAASARSSGFETEVHAAAQRTGLQPAMLSAIIGAEANSIGGKWDPNSTNPNSSAAGLGQFLSSTWETEAERPGSWLNRVAAVNGWLDAKGQIIPSERSALLNLRFDPRTSIEVTADFALSNLNALEQRGLLPANAPDEDRARYAYLAHHLGLGDATKFLSGGLSPDRAKTLLAAQIGTTAANGRIAQAGNAPDAHRQWLVEYIDGKIDLNKYASPVKRA